MIDPFSAWSRMVSAGLDMQSTWLRSLETLQASHDVVGARTEKIRAAAASPLTGDYAELSRMVPEKLDAFGRSAQIIGRSVLSMHAAWILQMERVGMMMFLGRAPTLTEATTLADQTANYTMGAMTAGAKLGEGALAPVHRTATGNARRLERKGAR